MLGLIWDEVEVHHVPQSGGAVHTVGTIHLSHQLDRKTRTRVPPKTARSRRVLDLDPDTARALLAGRGDSPGHAYVFTTRTGLPHDHRNIGGRVLARAVKTPTG